MTLVTKNNRPFTALDNLFNDLFSEWPTQWQKGSLYTPATNVTETNDNYELELNAAGRNKEDFQINVDNGLLTVSYEKKEETKAEGSKSIRKEFTFQSFKRSFTLDDTIDAASISAKYENGVLKLVLPKKAPAKEAAKSIAVS
jgi:HSP20 family protein